MSIELRPEVRAFAEAMELRLRDFDNVNGPTSWRDGTGKELSERRHTLLDRAESNLDDMRTAMAGAAVFGHGSANLIVQTAVDAANLAMMAVDLCLDGGLKPFA